MANLVWYLGLHAPVSETLRGGVGHCGIQSFCIFSIKIPLLGMEMVKLKQKVEPEGHHVSLHSVKYLFFLIF